MECMTLKPIFKHLFNLALLALLSTPVMAEIIVKDGFVRVMPPSAPNTAAYFTLINHGEPTTLVAVSTEIADKAELHTIVTENDVVKMREVSSLELPAHGTLELSERGNHVMLLGLKSALAEGQQVTLNLRFNDGQTLELTLPVSKAPVAGEGDDHHHHHH
ncbi:copper chaperone PCu(A)C [Shewanella sp. JM162201]|uniref:Copper chaperone PCu(A)C n=1 Tax=Shewanella jiangmenensis TaxID=2837387 RepID=A0ABS5V1S5_9GAMM|nr:copper chaperone PCu(A)C [Shewanella jiangmenensis]MBT1443870.1 copper chaperone PCu(A)C [Shewanella jiangmenensis]